MRSQTTRVTVVGGGLGGLVAAITAAEAGASVAVYEGHRILGGRARGTVGPFLANYGPHVVYSDGAMWTWLHERGLIPPYRRPPLRGFRFRYVGELLRMPPRDVLRALLWCRRTTTAPVDVAFRDWAAGRHGDRIAAALANAAGVATFTSDPGALSARFVLEKLRRVLSLPPAARYVVGGWSALVRRLEEHAASLGVEIHVGSLLAELPRERPVVVATELAAARRLLGDETLCWPSGRAALLDVGLAAGRGDPFVIWDLDEGGWVERFSAADPSLAPPRFELVQAQVGLRPGETLDAGVARIEGLLDSGFAGWRSREVWRRRSLADARTGALDPPGTTWRDRPAIGRGDGVHLCGDSVAAPGLLGEVAWASAVEAGRAAVAGSASDVGTRLGA